MTGTPAASPASAARLTQTFDAVRLAHELAAVTGHQWKRQRTHHTAGHIGPDTPTDWRVLPLHSPGGDPERTDPGGPGRDDYTPTRWLHQMPYLQTVLDQIPAPLNAVRLLALGPGAASQPHCDPKYALERGMVRLHIPILTHPDAVLILDGTQHCWQPGEFWYGNFSRKHQVRNTGPARRVHAVIDALLTRELAALFPTPWQDALASADVLYNRQPTPERAGHLPATVTLPSGFTDFATDTPLTGPGVAVHVARRDERLCLQTGERTFALAHIADGEYRYAGWSEQRTLRIGPDHVAVHARTGRAVTSQHVPLPAATDRTSA
ncbi:aspartyl/asparaginyl beta-hydroxylase domain-containing protein [Streptomyces sp. NBC_00647]|uniref:aspartyl/asparaginyl beta-hydroxylase domain-containing protein n=1 Tax=Streptomyces sp. NBC_00647 TaxID=2975796 RepID=UPI0032484200